MALDCEEFERELEERVSRMVALTSPRFTRWEISFVIRGSNSPKWGREEGFLFQQQNLQCCDMNSW
jgi:hypothetical protein